MDLKRISDLISKEAPLLGALVTIVNPTAGKLITLIGELFGGDPKNLEELANKIESDPNATAKLKELELKHEEEILDF